MVDTDLATIKAAKSDLIRKALDMAIVAAPTTVSMPTSFTTGASAVLQALPTGFKGIGYTTKEDGATWARDIESEDVTSHGSVEPTRRDITQDITTFEFSAQETNLQTLQLFYNLDLSGITPTAVTGEVQFAQPLQPATRDLRVIAIAQDGVGADTVYIARLLPKAMVSEPGDQVWSDTEAMSYPLTVTATPDETLGYSVKHAFFGPGWKSRLVAMGFPAAASS